MYRSLRVLRPSTTAVARGVEALPGIHCPQHRPTQTPVPTPQGQAVQSKIGSETVSVLSPGFAKHTSHPLEQAYFSLSEGSSSFRYDHKQMLALQKLARIYDDVVSNPGRLTIPVSKKVEANKPAEPQQKSGGFFSSLWGSKKEMPAATPSAPRIPTPTSPQGLYLYGGCGCGKTMLLDLFYSSLPADFPVRRLHWHMFARDGLQYLDKAPKDVIAFEHVAADISKHCKILLLDEILITNVSEALVVKELFRQLWARGTVVVATSNYRHDQLYEGGLNRRIFEEFIPEMKQQMPLHDFEADVDFRTADAGVDGHNFFHPINEATKKSMDEAYYAAGGGDQGTEIPLAGTSRKFKVTRASPGADVARFTFRELCEKPLGRSEYAAIAEKFHTVFMDELPELTADDGVALQRFVQLIDILYDKKVMLYVQSELPAESIHSLSEGSTIDQQWAWNRVSSMLHEMRSRKYAELARLMRPHLVLDTARSL